MPQVRLPRSFKRWTPIVISLISCGLIGGVLLFFPGNVRTWIAGILSAVLVGYLVNVLPDWIRGLYKNQQSPIAVTSKILDEDYMVTVDRGGKHVLVPASGHIVRLTVEATDSRTTIIQNLRPIVYSRSEATGSLSQHFGIVTPRPFEVLLDENPPCLKPTDPAGPNFPFKVGPGDPEVFDLKVLTSTGDVKWWLELSWTSSGQEGTLRVDLGGSPFRTMARPREYQPLRQGSG